MSQQKVDRYKEEKASRKEALKKQKQRRLLRQTVMAVIIVALLGWVGYSAVGIYQDSRPRQVEEVSFDAIHNYVNNLS
jgi:cell division septal protein FtsQ